MTAIILLLAAFLAGFLTAILFAWTVHFRQGQEWKTEYLRLMAGIKEARRDMLNPGKNRAEISSNLNKLFNGENNVR